MKSIVAILSAVVFLFAATVFAAPSADAKARGQFNFYGRSAGRALRGARESTGSFREYVQGTQPITPQIVRNQPGVREEIVIREQPGEIICSPQIAQVATDEIGDSIIKSEKHLAWMRRLAEAQKDKDTLASLDSIDRHLAVAKQHHATLCTRCMSDNVDANAAMVCCQTIDDALGKAISEHDALMKRLAEKQPNAK